MHDLSTIFRAFQHSVKSPPPHPASRPVCPPFCLLRSSGRPPLRRPPCLSLGRVSFARQSARHAPPGCSPVSLADNRNHSPPNALRTPRPPAGSVEHYTFPAVRSTTVEGDKRRIRSPEGLAATAGRAERRLCLESAFERPEVLEALAELTASVQVWRVDEQGYTPVDAVTRQAVIDRRDALGTLSVEIRSTRNDAVPWS